MLQNFHATIAYSKNQPWCKKGTKGKTHFYYVTNTLNAKWKTTSCLQHQWYPNLPFTHIILLMKFYLLIDWSETTKFSHGNGGNEHCCNNNNNKANEKIMNVHVSCAAPKGHCFCRWSLIGIYWFDLSIPHLVFTITLPLAQLLYMENQMYYHLLHSCCHRIKSKWCKNVVYGRWVTAYFPL